MWYLTVSGTLFIYYLGLFLNDTTTPKTDLTSWLVLLIAPLIWPVVLPLSILELANNNDRVTENSSKKVAFDNHN